MVEKLLAAIGLALCLALLLRMVLPAPTRRRWDAFWLGLWQGARDRVQRWRSGPDARQQAHDAIERARRRSAVQRDGNVIRPKAFDRDDGPGPPPTLH